MPERSALTNIVQIAPEVTPGTGVQPTKRLTSIGIEPGLSVEIADFRPAGSKYRSLTALGKEWVEAPVSGQPTYTELIYALASVVGNMATTEDVGGVAQVHVFRSFSSASDTIRTFTVQHGDASQTAFREQFTNGIFTELSLSMSRDGVELSGSMIGKGLQSTGNGDTLSPAWQASPTTLALVPILPTEIDVYISDAYEADPGDAEKMLRLTKVDWSIGARFNPIWVLDSAVPSFVTHVESEPSLQASITVEADTVGVGFLSTMRTGAEKFLKIVATSGTDADTGIPMSLMIDMPMRISNFGNFSDEDGLYAASWEFLGTTTSDADWVAGPGGNTAVMVTVVNDIDAL